MIDLNQYSKNLTKEELLEKYSEYDIFRNYIGNFELGENYNSPLRRGDDNPSFNIFYSKKNNCLLFKDFAGKRGDCIRFVQYLYSLVTYQDAINQIDKDMSLHIERSPTLKKDTLIKHSNNHDIRIVKREWNDIDIKWWKQFAISIPTLNKYNVYPIKGYYFDDKYYETKNLAYAYAEFKDNNTTFKIYRPNSSKHSKWRSNTPYSVHQGYTQLPLAGDIMIITKSLKDVMSIWECTDIPAIAVQSETSYIKESVVDEYKFRFDSIYTLFDNDRQGKELALAYVEMYDIPSIFIPDEYGVKDFSDLVKKLGRHNAAQILLKLIKK